VTELPPHEVPFAILAHYPELLVLDNTARTAVRDHIKKARGFNDFLQTIENQGVPGKDSGWARLEEIILKSGKPAENSQGEIIYRWNLSDETLKALPLFLAEVLRSALSDPALKDLCWTVQEGVPPGRESGESAAKEWLLKTMGPRYGLEIPEIDFNVDDSTFQLKLANKIPRHLGIYGEFLKNGNIVEPAGWKSRLPAGVSQNFETDKAKYLGLLLPNTPTAALPVPTDPQIVNFPLPSNTDSARILPGGIGNGNWIAAQNAAGVILTFIMDYGVPAILMNAGAGVEKDSWFNGLLTDTGLQAGILAAGEFIISEPTIRNVSALLADLSEKVAALLLDEDLKTLRKNIAKNIGDQAVENAAPFLGWTAQTLKALLDTQDTPSKEITQSTSRLLSIPATFSIALSPAMLFDLQVNLVPDPIRGEWPDNADHYEISIEYAGGFSQKKKGQVPQDPPAAPIHVTFGSVRSGGIVGVQASFFTAGNSTCARGTAVADSPSSPVQHIVKGSVTLIDEPVAITSGTRYVHKRILTYDPDSGLYAWQLAPAPKAVKSNVGICNPGQTGLCELVDITLRESARSIGYTWRASGHILPECGSSGARSGVVYLFQNIGAVNPNTAFKSLDCGFIVQPYLVYEPSPYGNSYKTGSKSGCNVYLDPRNSCYCLREVILDDTTPFNLSGRKSRGKFLENGLSGIAIHPAGYAAAVNRENSRLEILKLSDAPVDDAAAPESLLLSGMGSRQGLLDTPVGVDITPAGLILVLENGNARCQAFDGYGNPVSCFNGSPFLILKEEKDVDYQDIAISPEGLIFILSNINGGKQPGDYRLDIYNPDGSFLSRTGGVNAARIEVDSRGRVYTLNYESITGHSGAIEPSISEWIPSLS
jgi:hypothetical protein